MYKQLSVFLLSVAAFCQTSTPGPLTIMPGVDESGCVYLRERSGAGQTQYEGLCAPKDVATSAKYRLPVTTADRYLVGYQVGVTVSDYNFSYAPGVNILPGAVTVTFARGCPLGVNGADTNHYYYLSSGTGTAETVLGTEGTCTSGAATGTLTFVAANAHSGAWTIASASGGLKEAERALSAGGGRILIPRDTELLVSGGNGVVMFRPNITVECAGRSSVIKSRDNSQSTEVFLVQDTADGFKMIDCHVNGNRANAGTLNGTGITVLADHTQFIGIEISLTDYIGISFQQAAADSVIDGAYIHDNGSVGTGLGFGVHGYSSNPSSFRPSDIKIINSTIARNHNVTQNAGPMFWVGAAVCADLIRLTMVNNDVVDNTNVGGQIVDCGGASGVSRYWGISGHNTIRQTSVPANSNTGGVEFNGNFLTVDGNVFQTLHYGVAIQPAGGQAIGYATINGNKFSGMTTHGVWLIQEGPNPADGFVRVAAIKGNSFNLATTAIEIAQRSTHIDVDGNSFIDGITTPLSAKPPEVHIRGNLPETVNHLTFAELGAHPDGVSVYCSDCTPNTSPCAGSGTGSFADRVTGAWECRAAGVGSLALWSRTGTEITTATPGDQVKLDSHLFFSTIGLSDIGTTANYGQTVFMKNADFAPAGLVGNFTNVRKLNVMDMTGGTAFWDIQSGVASGVGYLRFRDNAGSQKVNFVSADGLVTDQAQFTMNLIPGTSTVDGSFTYSLGLPTRSWHGIYNDGAIIQYDADKSSYVEIFAPAVLAANYSFNLPYRNCPSGEFLTLTSGNMDCGAVGNYWTRTGTELSTTTAGDQLRLGSHILFTAASVSDIGATANYGQTIFMENADFAPSGVTGNFTNVRKLNILDGSTGGTTFWDFQTNISIAASFYQVRDNAGTVVHRLVQNEASVAINQAQFLLHLVPGNASTNADATYDVGVTGRRWRNGLFSGSMGAGSYNIGTTPVIDSTIRWSLGFYPSVDATHDIGSIGLRWAFATTSGGYAIHDGTNYRLAIVPGLAEGYNSSGTMKWQLDSSTGFINSVGGYKTNGTAGVTASGATSCTITAIAGGLVTAATCI